MQDQQTSHSEVQKLPIAWSADFDAAAALLEVVSKAHALDIRDSLPDAVEASSQATPEIFLLCFAPLEALARAMMEGQPPSTALEDWRQQARAVLAVKRSNRRRVHLLDLGAALRNPETFLQVSGFAGEVDAGEIASADAELDPMLVLMAQSCLTQDPDDQALVGEFEASAAGGGEEDRITSDPDAAFQFYREASWMRDEVGLLRGQIELMLEEMRLLQQQHQAAQEEALALGETRAQLEQRIVQLNQGIESYQAQLDTLQAETARLGRRISDKERGLGAAGNMVRELEVQGAETAAALERARKGRAEMEQLAKERLRQMEMLQATLRQLETSRSYRLTAPLRWLRARTGGKSGAMQSGTGRSA